MRRLFLACSGLGVLNLLALDAVFAPALLLTPEEGTPKASASAAPAVPRASGSTAGGSDSAGRSVTGTSLPPMARVPTIVAKFEKGGVEPSDTTAIRLLATAMIQDHGQRVVLEGHSDRKGNENFNHDLSLERANAVKEHLVRLGVTASRIETVGLGATRPLRTDENDDGALNRRVELRWVGP